jgi:hypothetical protein
LLPSIYSNPDPYRIGIGIIEIIFATILVLLGNLASFFKVNTDIIGEEIADRLTSEEPQSVRSS